MKIETFRIWVILFIAIFAVSGYTYFTLQENQEQLLKQSYRSLELTKLNVLNSWDTFQVQLTQPDYLQTVDESDSTISKYEIPQILLNQMPPSNFFDIILITDSDGNVLHTSTDVTITSVPESARVDPNRLGATQSRLVISNKEYQAFQTPFTLQENSALNFHDRYKIDFEQEMDFHLFAAISQGRINRAGKRFSFTVLYLLFTLVILLLISFPILRVIGMGRGDTLLRSHVYQIGLSIILLAIFIGYTLSFITSRSEIISEQNQTVHDIAKQVSIHQKNEIARLIEYLENYFDESRPNLADQPEYNEVFEIDHTGSIQRMKFQDIDEELDNSLRNKLPQLDNRYYFTQAATSSFLLGSHISYLQGGRLEGVISRKIPNEGTRDVVRAITFELDRFDKIDADSVNPQGLKYLLLNPHGDIYYQSPSITTSIPNIKHAISTDEWHEIRTLINNNDTLEDSLEIPVSFEGHAYTAHLTRPNWGDISLNPPIWMLTFKDQNLRYLRSYAIFIYSSTGVAILVITFSLVSLFFFISRRESHYLNTKQFSYSWFRPSHIKRRNYILLIVLLGIHICYFIYIMINDYHNFWLIVFLYCETIAYIALLRFILLSSFLTNWNKKQYWITPLLITFTILGFKILAVMAGEIGDTNGGKAVLIGCLFLIQISGIALIVILNIRRFDDHSRRWFDLPDTSRGIIQNKTETIYALTFVIWVILVGLLPGYAIHHSAFHYENTLWNDAAKVQSSNDNESYNEYAPSERTSDTIQHKVINLMEYQRRKWVNNFSGISYPVVDSYYYANKSGIQEAFSHQEDEDHHEAGLSKYLFFFTFLILSGLFLFFLIRKLSRQIFLTEYWNFTHDTDHYGSLHKFTYLVTLDRWKGLEFLKEKFLSDKTFSLVDLAGTELPDQDTLRNDRNQGYLLLNIEHSMKSTKRLNDLSSFITEAVKTDKFVLLSGSMSVRELSEIQPLTADPQFSDAMAKWLDSISYYSTILLPIDHSLPQIDEEISSENDFRYRLAQEIRFGPHHTELSSLLNNKIDYTNSKIVTEATFERFVLTVQRYSKAYYQNIWNKLSFREKQMVFNYANEGFVNYRNFDVLTELLQKGVFRLDPYREMITLFNQSFTNFATQAPSDQTLKNFKADKKKNGNISHIRNAVLTFIFLSILGLSIIAPELLDRYIGAISGGLAVISTLASVINQYTLKIPFLSKHNGDISPV